MNEQATMKSMRICPSQFLDVLDARERDSQDKDMTTMKRNDSLLDKRVSVRSIGAAIGGAFLTAVVAGLFYHRRTIKRLIEIKRM